MENIKTLYISPTDNRRVAITCAALKNTPFLHDGLSWDIIDSKPKGAGFEFTLKERTKHKNTYC